MKWKKCGLIYCPSGEKDWMQNSFMTPVPVLLNNETIRIFGGIRDKNDISRIGFIDVSSSDPKKIIYVHKEPVLDIGEDGCFDDNGIILGSILKDENEWRMYYIGFQKVQKAKFYAFSGVANSNDLTKFKRRFITPIQDRKDWMRFIGAVHTVIRDEDRYRVFYAAGNRWIDINGISYPCYSTYYTESKDGYTLDYKINNEIVATDDKKYRIGRPTVYKINNVYIMFCTYDTIDKEYGITSFESINCKDWKRCDNNLSGIYRSSYGWDSEMVCYPTIIKSKDKTYLFYNGNGMGRTGVGYAELIND